MDQIWCVRAERVLALDVQLSKSKNTTCCAICSLKAMHVIYLARKLVYAKFSLSRGKFKNILIEIPFVVNSTASARIYQVSENKRKAKREVKERERLILSSYYSSSLSHATPITVRTNYSLCPTMSMN